MRAAAAGARHRQRARRPVRPAAPPPVRRHAAEGDRSANEVKIAGRAAAGGAGEEGRRAGRRPARDPREGDPDGDARRARQAGSRGQANKTSLEKTRETVTDRGTTTTSSREKTTWWRRTRSSRHWPGGIAQAIGGTDAFAASGARIRFPDFDVGVPAGRARTVRRCISVAPRSAPPSRLRDAFTTAVTSFRPARRSPARWRVTSGGSTTGSYQDDLATKELDQIDQQIARRRHPHRDRDRSWRTTSSRSRTPGAIDEVMRTKYTNQELYDWMVGQLSDVLLPGLPARLRPREARRARLTASSSASQDSASSSSATGTACARACWPANSCSST